MNNIVKISVRNLVEFVLNSGDIDNERIGTDSMEAMLAGGRLHRKIQKRQGVNYRAEVPLKMQFDYEEFVIEVEGRADGITDGELCVIDEIKGVSSGLTFITEPVPVHEAQAMCYGYFYCTQKELDRIKIHLIYGDLETEETKDFEKIVDYEYLKEWFSKIIDKYAVWARYVIDNTAKRNETAKVIEFPFEYREGQREIVKNVYKVINMKKDLFIQAPTGVGKTMSVIYPSVKAMAYGNGEKLFYLTAKTITGVVAAKAFNTLRDKGLHFRNVSIIAKEKVCILDKPQCNPRECPRAKGHFDRVNEAVYDIITNEYDINRDKLLEYAKKHNVCPFEMQLDVSNWVDGIICDYNYAFDPNASLKRYFKEGAKDKYILLVDEAHNLVERAREMYSAVLVKEEVMAGARIAKEVSKRLYNALNKVNKEMLSLKRECMHEYEMVSQIASLELTLLRVDIVMKKFLEENKKFEDREVLLELYFNIKNFLNICECVDDNYRIYTSFKENGDFVVKLMCINPAGNMKLYKEKAVSSIFFSATLLPVNYYKELLSGNTEDYAMYIESPFDAKNRLLIMADDVTSKYTMRNDKQFERIAEYIKEIAKGKNGNYMVFFPSYALMNKVYQLVYEAEWSDGKRLLVQNNSMKEADREEFLKEFEKKAEETLIAFCVMGGIFSEGIDLEKDKLIGSIVIGTGLPQICPEREIIMNYFNEEQRNGFDYAYRFPGMNKVLQAAGRVIRTVDDEGVIALLDNRFLQYSYKALFPKEWADIKRVNLKNITDEINNFWKGREN